MSEPYLIRLALKLADGLTRLPTRQRFRHVDFLRRAQNTDGGFSGREGGSDLYYTGFALRGLAVLDALSAEVCQRAGAFLQDRLSGQTTVIDFFSLFYSAFLIQLGGGPDIFAKSPAGWEERIVDFLAKLRTADGGYAKGPGAPAASTYHTFLVGLCFQLLGRPMPDPDRAARFVLSRRRDDGGFVEIGVMKRSGTNPTAAGVGLLQMIDGETSRAADVLTGAVNFLAAMPSIEGGFRANDRAPLADLLSTFTGLWTLDSLGALDRVDLASARDYVHALELPSGGFRGGHWDDRTDVEYTFYGLGCLGLFESHAANH